MSDGTLLQVIRRERVGALYLGTTDAKNELVAELHTVQQRFLKGFVELPDLDLETLLNKRKYFVTGAKGTGKTALLRYLNERAAADMKDVRSSFLLFNTQVTEEEKQTLSRAARLTAVSANDIGDFDPPDYVPAWKWFLYRQLMRQIRAQRPGFVAADEHWERFCVLVEAPALPPGATADSGVLPRLKKNKVVLDPERARFLGIYDGGGGDVAVTFSQLSKEIDAAYGKLSYRSGTLLLFVDELELVKRDEKQFKRDALMIAGLVKAIEDINRRGAYAGISFHIIAAVRSEVLRALEGAGTELNKPLTDFGVRINWNRSGSDVSHPLIQIILKRIRSSGNIDHADDAELWKAYFGSHNCASLLHRTWHRPRDLVRLLNLARDESPDAQDFSQGLELTAKDYAEECWREIAEELSARYNQQQVNGMRTVLRALGSRFSRRSMEAKLKELVELHDEVQALAGRKLGTVLCDLYRVGAVGNIWQDGGRTFVAYYHRGDVEPSLERDFQTHLALEPILR